MSNLLHRVRFGTVNDVEAPTLVASKFNGMLWPTASIEPDSYDPPSAAQLGYFPFEMRHDHVIQWHWRVRGWNVAVTGPVVEDHDITHSLADDEADLTFYDGNWSTSPVQFQFAYPTSAQVGGVLHSSLIALGQASRPNYLKPSLFFAVSLVSLGLSVTTHFSAPGYLRGLCNFVFSDYTYTVPCFIDPAAGVAANITVTPIDFWPYQGLNGAPIYDTLTGAQLQPPTA